MHFSCTFLLLISHVAESPSIYLQIPPLCHTILQEEVQRGACYDWD